MAGRKSGVGTAVNEALDCIIRKGSDSLKECEKARRAERNPASEEQAVRHLAIGVRQAERGSSFQSVPNGSKAFSKQAFMLANERLAGPKIV